MLVVSLLGLFFGAVYESLLIGLRAATAANRREDVRRQLSRAMDQLTREIASAYDVDAAQDQRFQFDARDINGDGSNDTNINYRVQNGDLQRVYSGDTVTLIPDLTSLTFTYLNSAGASTSTAGQVRVMQVTVTATRDGEAITMSAAADLRNL